MTTKAPFVMNIWPKRRANAAWRNRSDADRQYTATVRKNKGEMASSACSARAAENRKTTQDERRIQNLKIIEINEKKINEAITIEFRTLRESRRKQRDQRWTKRLENAYRASRDAGTVAKRAWQQTIATPKWANKGAMLALYRDAKKRQNDTGELHHVDHIVPLISTRVCGLHCEQNMRIILGVENSSKGNRRWPDMP